MPNLITATNCSEAWNAAVKFILKNGSGENLIVHIVDPTSTEDKKIEILNPKQNNGDNIYDVINTIFPYKFWSRNEWDSRIDFYRSYLAIHNKSRKKRWGTYFQRLISFGEAEINQLENIINAIATRRTNYSSAYTLHITSCIADSNTKIMGGPCLQYVQIIPNNSSINLVAVYRNHDYFNKALGNFVGLTRLLTFVCINTNKQPGSVTCHSVHYYIANKKAVDSIASRYQSETYDTHTQ